MYLILQKMELSQLMNSTIVLTQQECNDNASKI